MSENQVKTNAVGPLPSAAADVGPVPALGVPVPPRGADIGRASSHGASPPPSHAASGDAAYNRPSGADVGRVPSHGVPAPAPADHPPRRLRRLHRVWPDRDGNISYLLTPCVDGRASVLDNEITFERFVAFLLDSPKRYHWYGRRFVIMRITYI